MEQRISIEEKEEGTLIKIKAYSEESKQKVFTVWLLAWTLSGLAIISQLFFEPEDDLKSMLFIFTAFWAYFEFKAIKIFRWRRSGEEQILLAEDKIHIGRTVSNRGFLKPYRLDLINEVREVEEEGNSLAKSFSDSYWVMGRERLCFSAGGKMIYLGLRLTDKECQKLMKVMNKKIRENH